LAQTSITREAVAAPATRRTPWRNRTGHATDAMVEHYSLVGSDEKAIVSRAVAERIGVTV
jgi:hypothetical protein